MEVRVARIFGFGVLQLSVCYRPEVPGVEQLIQGDLLGLFILDVADTTISEGAPLDLEISEDLLDFGKDVPNHSGNTCQLKIINVFAHDGGQTTTVVLHAKLVVDLAGYQPTLIGDSTKLDGESTRCIT